MIELRITDEDFNTLICALQTGMVQAGLMGDNEMWERFNNAFNKIYYSITDVDEE